MKNLNLFISSTFLLLTFTSFNAAQSMEDHTPIGVPKKPSGIQLAKAADDRLEATVGTGNNVLLKIDMDLKIFRRLVDEDHATVSGRLFLTDFNSSPTKHPDVRFEQKIACESTPPACVLANKPQSFNSYTEFTNWLNQAYFTNQVKLTYDFKVDVQALVPSLAQYLFFVPPDGYHFMGTYVVDNTKIIPDAASPQISYHSERGDINATTATLGGTIHLNKKNYAIDNFKQVFPHQKVERTILEEDKTSRFYHYQWLANSQTISRIAYTESSVYELKNWPNLPANEYSIIRKDWKNKENILHISCFVGSSGQEIDITDGKIFIFKKLIAQKNYITENMLSDEGENLYVVKYKNLDEIRKNLGLDTALLEYDTINERIKNSESLKMSESRLSSCEKEYEEAAKKPCHQTILYDTSNGHQTGKCGALRVDRFSGRSVPDLCPPCKEKAEKEKYLSHSKQNIKDVQKALVDNQAKCSSSRYTIKKMMEDYQTQAGVPHSRWEEFKS